MKQLTKLFALIWIVGLCVYSSILIGTLGHELAHKQTATEIHAITINYDGSGKTTAEAFNEEPSHQWIYINGFIIEVFMMLVTLISLIVLMWD